MIPLSVRAVGMICSVGDNAPECAASVRAGVQRIAESPVRSRRLHPLRMGLVPATSLAPLPVVDAAPRGTRHRRILRLAHAVLAEVRAASGGLSTPLSLVTSALDDGAPLLDDLAALPDARVDHARSAHFPAGAAGVFVALRDAAHRIAHGEVGAVTIVCADSLFDPARLDAMQIQRRLLVDDVMDGFVPGEGAAALLLTAAAPGGVATLRSVGTEPDPFTPRRGPPAHGRWALSRGSGRARRRAFARRATLDRAQRRVMECARVVHRGEAGARWHRWRREGASPGGVLR